MKSEGKTHKGKCFEEDMWTNRETWLVWADNFFDYEEIVETVKSHRSLTVRFNVILENPEPFVIEKLLTVYLADWMEKRIKGDRRSICECPYVPHVFTGKWENSHFTPSRATGRIDWIQIADRYIKDAAQ